MRRAAALVAIAALGMLLAAEASLRVGRHLSPFLQRMLHLPGHPMPWWQATTLDALLAMAPFRPTPRSRVGGFVLNDDGFATPPYEVMAALGSRRVVALGDSFTFDSAFVPQDQMWHRLAAARLDGPVEVVNLGLPAVGPPFALRVFELEGARLRPDVVLFGLFLGNDLTDEAGERGSFLMRHVMTWRFAKRIRQLLAGELSFGPAVATDGPGGHPVDGYRYDPHARFFPADAFARVTRETRALFADRERLEPLIARTLATLVVLNGAVRDAGGRLIVVVMPDRVQVDPALRDGDDDFGWLQARITTALDRAGIRWVDLLPAFRDAADPAALWRDGDVHWSAAGNAVAADAIASKWDALLD